ncbi:GIY-YIG nuclease family protein [Nostoc sp. B(2019)]|nr:GIY-YIG nuclease family protein [Nostoc sp. B(2019)]
MNIVCDRSLLNCSGVYVIKNTVNGKIYVGSAVRFRNRWQQHKEDLNSERHDNTYLLRAWKKYGAPAFVVDVLEVVEDKQHLIAREQYWLDKLKAYERNTGYNICRIAGSTLGFKLSPEARARKSAMQKGRTCKPMSEAQKQLLSQKRSKKYVVIAPDGQHQIVHNLKKFCQENGLGHASMNSVSTGRITNHRGWRCLLLTQEIMSNIENGYQFLPWNGTIFNQGGYIVTDPSFSSFYVKNLSAFCREQGLDQTGMQAVCFGRVHHCKGWQCEYATSQKLEELEEGKYKPKRSSLKSVYAGGYIAIAPDGALHKVERLYPFCRKHGLDNTGMLKVAQGKICHHKQWRCHFLSDDLLKLFKMGEKVDPFTPRPLGRKYLVTEPSGKQHGIYNLNAFCREHRLSQSTMQNVATGKYKQHKGWNCKYLD